jgi:hypothetical protein
VPDVKDANLRCQVFTRIKEEYKQDIWIRIVALDYSAIIVILFAHCILGCTFQSWALLQFSTRLVGGLDVPCAIAPKDREVRRTVRPSRTPETHSTALADIR